MDRERRIITICSLLYWIVMLIAGIAALQFGEFFAAFVAFKFAALGFISFCVWVVSA